MEWFKIDPKIIGHIKNLRIVSVNKNSTKHTNSEILLNQLIQEINNFEKG